MKKLIYWWKFADVKGRIISWRHSSWYEEPTNSNWWRWAFSCVNFFHGHLNVKCLVTLRSSSLWAEKLIKEERNVTRLMGPDVKNTSILIHDPDSKIILFYPSRLHHMKNVMSSKQLFVLNYRIMNKRTHLLKRYEIYIERRLQSIHQYIHSEEQCLLGVS